ncbi:DMT family transporter [Methylobacterium oryzihabitans]|uniref:DMT family transporter n=1 Tax=Methylobacterium oryzihabitans TaxID=2499852 RepID=A0A437PCU4_9HYPH|nr:DMT family transporter [Methylobacterium oryzihabitans]RVU20069.1 DMT family transporter [Methylobacterium oryzihabitans]
MAFLIVPIAILAGILNTVQAGANATLSKATEQPVLAALVVTGANALVYLAAAPFLGLGWPGAGRLAQVPWWGWLGGAMGGAYVLAMILFAGRLGAATFTGLTVTAGIVTSVVLDHYGWLGFAQHGAGPWRILGCGLMIAGVALVTRF